MGGAWYPLFGFHGAMRLASESDVARAPGPSRATLARKPDRKHLTVQFVSERLGCTGFGQRRNLGRTTAARQIQLAGLTNLALLKGDVGIGAGRRTRRARALTCSVTLADINRRAARGALVALCLAHRCGRGTAGRQLNHDAEEEQQHSDQPDPRGIGDGINIELRHLTGQLPFL